MIFVHHEGQERNYKCFCDPLGQIHLLSNGLCEGYGCSSNLWWYENPPGIRLSSRIH